MEDKTIASIGLDEEYPRRGTPPAQLHLLSLQRAIRERKQDERIHMLRKLRGLSSICYHRYNLWQDRFTYLRHSFRPTVNLPCFFACLFPCFEAPIRRRSDLSTWMLSELTDIATCGVLGVIFQPAKTKLQRARRICDELRCLSACESNTQAFVRSTAVPKEVETNHAFSHSSSVPGFNW